MTEQRIKAQIVVSVEYEFDKEMGWWSLVDFDAHSQGLENKCIVAKAFKQAGGGTVVVGGSDLVAVPNMIKTSPRAE